MIQLMLDNSIRPNSSLFQTNIYNLHHMQSYRHGIPVSGHRVKSTTGNHHNHIHEDSFSDDGIPSGGQPAFQTQNFLYELQSRCNNLEYEKTKNEMMHENIVSDLKSKVDYLQLLSSNLSQQNQSLSQERDLMRMLLAEVRQQNYSFSKQIGQLKIEINSIVCHAERDESQQQCSLQFKSELLKKDEIIDSLQRQLTVALNPKNHKQQLFDDLQTKNKQLKEQIKSLIESHERSKSEIQEMRTKIRDKDLKYQQERNRLSHEVQILKDNCQSKKKKQNNDINEQIRKLSDLLQVKQQHIKVNSNERAALENRVNELMLEVGRLKCQKNNLQQLNQYLQKNAQENEIKRKELQQEIFKNQQEISDLRTQIFNQKLELKKQLNNQKLQFQEERIRYVEQMEEKSKEVFKLKEQNSYSNRHAVDIQELSMKTQGIITDLDKANNQISKLNSENQALRVDLKALKEKLQQKHQKYCNLQAKLKAENAERVKALQTSVYKLQEANNQLELKLEISQKRYGNQESKTQNNKQLFDLLKSEIKEKDQQIRQLEQRIRQLQVTKKNLLDEINKAQGQIRLARELQSNNTREDRITAIQLLKQQISNLKEQVTEQRQASENQKRQFNFREQKLCQQLQIKHNETDMYRRQKQLQENLIKKLQQQLKSKDYQFQQISKKLTALQKRNQQYEQRGNSLKTDGDLVRNVANGRKYSSQYIKSQKLKQQGQNKSDRSQLLERIQYLQKENMSLKIQYSKSLQETNAILIRYQSLQQKYRKLAEEKDKNNGNTQGNKIRITQLENQCQRLRQIIFEHQNQERQFVRVIHELKGHKAAQSFTSPIPIKTRRESQQLWLDKDFKLPERDINEINAYRRHQRHRI